MKTASDTIIVFVSGYLTRLAPSQRVLNLYSNVGGKIRNCVGVWVVCVCVWAKERKYVFQIVGDWVGACDIRFRILTFTYLLYVYNHICRVYVCVVIHLFCCLNDHSKTKKSCNTTVCGEKWINKMFVCVYKELGRIYLIVILLLIIIINSLDEICISH